jgi:hypothetical protein
MSFMPWRSVQQAAEAAAEAAIAWHERRCLGDERGRRPAERRSRFAVAVAGPGAAWGVWQRHRAAPRHAGGPCRQCGGHRIAAAAAATAQRGTGMFGGRTWLAIVIQMAAR